ncbi:MAG: InlB B-repeat-containing protein [Clostridiales Family XIII bacterium]|jgi:uncharacterized repeat protein (TIGR02543 family)|nr:InlB B-repeat-containing protein [Clostridiales Family XIII bacterium]
MDIRIIKTHRTSRLIAMICIVALTITAFACYSYGAEPRYKVMFYQLAMTPEEGAAQPEDTISIAYNALTQWPDDGDTAKNPGAVAYAGEEPDAHHFLGWYEFDAPDDSPYDFSTPVTKNLTLFARFTDDHLVTFLSGFGESFLTKRVKPGGKLDEPTDGEMSLFTAPAGKHFDSNREPGGWTKQDGSAYDFGSPVYGDLTLTPSLVEGNSLVYFVSEGSQIPFEMVATGEKAREPDRPSRAGYDFLHWSLTKGGAAFDFSSTAIKGDMTLYAVWKPASVDYTVVIWREKKNITGDAGTDPSNYEYAGKFTQTATAGTPMDAMVTNARTLCASQSPVAMPSWTEFGFAKSSSETVLGNGATVLNVYYKRAVYTFSFTPYYRGSGFAATSKATMTLGGNTYTDTSRYSFKAKYEQDVSAVWPVQPLAKLVVPNSNLNFQGWKVPDVNTTFVSRVVSVSEDILPTSGKAQTLSAYYLSSGMTVNLHYMFETPDGKNMPGAVSYTGRYYVQDETYSQSAFSAGSPFSLKEIRGMTAQTTHSLQMTDDGFVSPTGKTLIDQYLFYNRVRYTITFNSQGGSNVSFMARDGFLPGAKLAEYKPDDPTRTGYAFEGWYTETDYMTRFDFETGTMPDSNIILYAKWTRSPRTVSVYDGLANGSLIGTYRRAYGEYIGEPEAALADARTNINYRVGEVYPGKGEFIGWVIPIGPGEKTPLSAELPVTGDISVYADFKPQTFTVTYRSGDAKGGMPPVDTQQYQRGADARLLSPSGSNAGAGRPGTLVPPDDREFIGWIDENGDIHYPGQMIRVRGDTVLTAKYAEVDRVAVYVYHINYPADARDSNGNPITDPGNLKQYVLQGTKFDVLGYGAYSPTPEPESYRFAGWAESKADADAGKVAYKGGETATATRSDDLRKEYDRWAVWTKYFPVVFDAGYPGRMGSGVSRIEYQIPNGSSLKEQGISVPIVTARDGDTYSFQSWESLGKIVGNDEIPGAKVTGPVTYSAVYSASTPPFTDTYFGITFDAGGDHGDLESGGDSVTYEVKSGGSLKSDAALNRLPEVKTSPDYEFLGWAPSDRPTSYLSGDEKEQLLNSPVTKPATYVAVYAGLSDMGPDKYYTVTFDAGGVYGVISTNKAASSALFVEEGTPLSGVDGFRIPDVDVKDDDFMFIGWSPAVNMESPVNEVRTYTARYAYTPQGISGRFYEVRFELGSEGSYRDIPVTSYLVEEGSSLSNLKDASGHAIFDPVYFRSDNIATEKDFSFIGWSPDLDPDAPVYAPRVYRALYAYTPDPIYEYTRFEVGEDDPDDDSVQALGYEGYYDGIPHGIRYHLNDNTELSSLISFWFDEFAVARSPGARALQVADSEGRWVAGLPPDEIHVIDKAIKLTFAANGRIPHEATRKIIIKPRPIIPKAVHANIHTGDAIPLRSSYGFSISYDGKAKDGKLIGDVFDFGAHKGEFVRDDVQIATTYMQGNPKGDYPIYAKAGVYGDYEIYEGSEGSWPAFAGWRLAGVLHVSARSVDPGNGSDDEDGSNADDDGKGGGASDTGDGSHPALWTALLVISSVFLVVLISASRRTRKRAIRF